MRDGHEGEEREQPSIGCPCGLLSETSIKLSPLRMVIHPCFEQKRIFESYQKHFSNWLSYHSYKIIDYHWPVMDVLIVAKYWISNKYGEEGS